MELLRSKPHKVIRSRRQGCVDVSALRALRRQNAEPCRGAEKRQDARMRRLLVPWPVMEMVIGARRPGVVLAGLEFCCHVIFPCPKHALHR